MAFCAELNRTAATVTVSPELFYKVLKENTLRVTAYRTAMARAMEMEAEGRTAEAKEQRTAAGKVKSQMPGWIFQCEGFTPHRKKDRRTGRESAEAAWRSQEHSMLNGLCMLDFDHIDDPMEVFRSKVMPTIDHGNPHRIRMAFVTPSGKGLKLVFEADIEAGNLASNQLKVAGALGMEPDESCKDSSRLAFSPAHTDLLYLEPSVFTYKDEAYAAKYNPQYSKGLSQPDMFGNEAPGKEGDALTLFKDAKSGKSEAPVDSATGKMMTEAEMDAFRYNDKYSIQDIIDAWVGDDIPGPGKRHDTLLKLAGELRHVTDMNSSLILRELKRQPWVQDIIDRGEDVEKTVADAMSYRYYSSMPSRMALALERLQKMEKGDDMPDAVRQQFYDFGRRIAKLSKHFPTLKLLIDDFSTDNYASVMFVGGALYGTLATRTWYHYWYDPEVERRLNYGIFVIADPASGKSFAGKLYKTIMEPIMVADKVGNDAVNKYKRALKERGTSAKEQKKEAIKAPDAMVRIHGTRTANGVFIEDMDKCYEIVEGRPMHLHLFTFDSELDSITIASRSGQWIDKSIFELKAFHNEEDNQQYKNVDSVNGPFDVFWNYVYTGTPLSLRRKVNERNFGSGLYSRLAVLPLTSDPYEIAPFKRLDAKITDRIAQLKEWAYRLDKVHGELPLDDLMEATWQWTKDQMDIARIEQRQSWAYICRRVPYYGINIAAPYILMRHWDEWEQTRSFTIDAKDIALCQLVMDIQLCSQKYFFGKYAEMYYDEKRKMEAENAMRHTDKIVAYYNTLGKEFTVADMISQFGISAENARTIVHRWHAEGLLNKKGTKRSRIYMKLKESIR